jgi:hypothetical protein
MIIYTNRKWVNISLLSFGNMDNSFISDIIVEKERFDK